MNRRGFFKSIAALLPLSVLSLSDDLEGGVSNEIIDKKNKLVKKYDPEWSAFCNSHFDCNNKPSKGACIEFGKGEVHLKECIISPKNRNALLLMDNCNIRFLSEDK